MALSLFLASIFALDLTAALFEMAIPPSLCWFHVVAGIIFLFGVGYYIIWRDLSQNRGLVVLGVIEKFFFFAIILIYHLLGHFNFLAVLLVIVDAVFGGLYLEFLVNYRE